MRTYASTVEYVKGSGGMTGFCQNTPLKPIPAGVLENQDMLGGSI